MFRLHTKTLLLALLSNPLFTNAGSYLPITIPLPNPTNVTFYLYVPDKLQASPPILVNPHWCHGSAQATYNGTRFARHADTHGFLVIYPDSPHTEDKCWDVSSAETLHHDAGGDSLGIANMVRWTLEKYKADKGRVFVAGVSSGAMMTSTLLATYPDLFAAGSAWSGVPFSCFSAPGDGKGAYGRWSDECAKGQLRRSGAEWAARVKDAYPGYQGWRPKVQIFHGTADEVLDYALFGEEVKLWTSVLGLAAEPSRTVRDSPREGWTKNSYGRDGWFEATTAANVSHNIPVLDAVIMDWFELACTGSNCFRWGKGGPPRAEM